MIQREFSNGSQERAQSGLAMRSRGCALVCRIRPACPRQPSSSTDSPLDRSFTVRFCVLEIACKKFTGDFGLDFLVGGCRPLEEHPVRADFLLRMVKIE